MLARSQSRTEVPGKKGFEVLGCSDSGKFGEQMREIRVRLYAIGAGRFDQRVQAGARGGTGGGLTEQAIPPSDHKRPYGVLDPIGCRAGFVFVRGTAEACPIDPTCVSAQPSAVLTWIKTDVIARVSLEQSRPRVCFASR